MKIKNILLGIALLPMVANAENEYKLVWEDNFDGAKLDETIWTAENSRRGGGNAEMQYYIPEAATIEKHPSGVSCLVLNAKRENYKGRPATSARLNTQDKLMFTYGKLEARIQLPYTADGLWPAFWMLGNDLANNLGDDDSVDAMKKQLKKEGKVIWPKCGEIDILECGHANGIKDGIQDRYFNGACHWGEDFNGGAYPNFGMNNTAEESIQGEFHTFTLIWDKEAIRMYLDLDKNPDAKPYYNLPIAGKKKKNAPARYFCKPFYITLNLAVGGYFTGIHEDEKYPAEISADSKNFQKITALPKDGTPAKMYVDYIRLYQKGEKGEQFIKK